MGQNPTKLVRKQSSGSSDASFPRSYSVHENLVRERNKKEDIEDIYTIVRQIGQGGLCTIYKIRKKEDKVGGSSRPENAKKRSIFRHLGSPKNSSKQTLTEGGTFGERDGVYGYPLFFALKVINLSLVKEDKIDQLKNEVEILKTLDHMNIIKAYETYRAKATKKLMIIMELCTGGDLYARIPYTEHEAARITKQILSAISYIHERKIVHRDLKMENIIFESDHPDSPIKVIDFGLSKEYTQRDHILVERVGTLYSMSPETMQGAYDEKADIWSIGVCTYMLLAGGDKPFEGKTPKELVAKVLVGLYDFEGEIWRGKSEKSKDFIRDLLVVEAKQRPSASAAWRHSWIEEYATHPAEDPEESQVSLDFADRVRECMIRYADTGPFRKLALNVIAKRSTPREIFKLRKVFHSFDTLNTGTITLSELREALAQCNVQEHEVENVFKQIDVNRNNVINYTEFLAACLEAQGELEEFRLAEAFDLMDSDDSGYISRDNLRQILGMHSDEDYIDKLIAEADFDRNGKISYAEFLRCFSRESKRRVSKIYNQRFSTDDSNDTPSSSSHHLKEDCEELGLELE